MSIDPSGDLPLMMPLEEQVGLTPADPRSAPPRWFTLMRKALRLSWLAFVFYLGIVISSLAISAAQGNLTWETFLESLLIYGPARQHPLLVAGFLAAAVLFVALGRWADHDLKRELAAQAARERALARQEQAAQVRRNIDRAIEGLKDLTDGAPTKYGPPLDTRLLPVPPHIVGREADQAWLRNRLGDPDVGAENSITALSGLDGIGKTTLAGLTVRRLHDDGHFPDGIAVIRCEGMVNSADVLSRALARFHPLRRPPQVSTHEQLAETARALLKDKDALVVLDSVEPGLDLRDIVLPLQESNTPILLTAWQTLDEHVVPHEASRLLAELPKGDALELFALSYGRGSAAAFTRQERAAAERIVALLRYHTYAITLTGASARQEGRPLNALADELENDPQTILDLRDHDQLRPMAIAIGRSTKNLPEDTRQLLTALAAFGTPEFSRNAAIALCVALGISSPAGQIGLLLQRILIEADTNDAIPSTSDRERLRLHPLLRAYVVEDFQNGASQDEQQQAYGAVATYYATYAARVSPREQAFDEGNIIAALEWAHVQERNDLVAVLTAAMARFWCERWRTAEALRYFPWGIAAATSLANASGSREDQLRVADLELMFGQILQNIGRLDEADAALNANLYIRRRIGDREGESKVLLVLGELAQLRGRLSQARKYFDQVLAFFSGAEGASNKDTVESVLCYLGELDVMSGQLSSGMEYFERSMALCRERENIQGESTLLAYEGNIALLRGDSEGAREMYNRSVKLAQQEQDRRGEAESLAKLGTIALARQRLDEADGYFQKAHDICIDAQDRPGMAAVYNLKGRLFQARGRLAEAARHYALSMEIAHDTQDRRRVSILTADMGRLAQAQGNLDEAAQLYRQALNLSAYTGDIVHVAATAVAFGEFLQAHPERIAQGCVTLVRALQLCDGTELPDAQKGKEIARRIGCATPKRDTQA